MADYSDSYKYTPEHEWVAIDGDVGTVGITDHAQAELGDVVFVELPEVDAELALGAEAGVVESVKAASDIYVPVSGKILAVNEALADDPELVNNDPYEDGWFFRMKPSDAAELEVLLTAEAYAAVCEDE